MKSLYYRITGPVTKFIMANHGYVAAALLGLMFVLGVTAMAGNSAIVDEVAHIPAGYSYLHYGDYRLNPEHPPLMKDLAGLPLQFMHLKFPDTEPAWTTDVNGQWESGWNFLYHIGNNADAIIFWARLPILLVAIAFGVFLYWLARRRWGTAVALLTLFFYALSPNFLAHSSLVTTDLGASVFIFLAIVAFARFANKPSGNNLVLLSVALAGAQLAKFSAVLLFPLLGLVTLGLVWLAQSPKKAWDRLAVYSGGFIAASSLSVVWIWLFYAPHVWNMPEGVQDKLIAGSLPTGGSAAVGHLLQNINGFSILGIEILKPIVQYILGLTMVFGRVAGGNVTYFNGQVSNSSFHGYFPELFVFKTQVALLILMVVAVVVLLWRYVRHKDMFKRFQEHFRTHVLEWSLGLFAGFYFFVSVSGNLNLGIRHILPVYLPLFVLVAIATMHRLEWLSKTHWRSLAVTGFAVLLVWYGGSTLASHPYYLSYFNELIGGPANSGKYFSDSSVDWGQDLRRLKAYVDEHPDIHHIAIDYFGGGVPAYYFCTRKYDDKGQLIATAAGYDCSHSKMEEWHSQYGQYTGQYIAVSETFLENDRYYSELNSTPGYEYLREKQPVAKIGYSIYVFKLY